MEHKQTAFGGCKTDEGLTCGAGVEAGVEEDWAGSSKLNQLDRGSAWPLLAALVPSLLPLVPSLVPTRYVSYVKGEVLTSAVTASAADKESAVSEC